MKYSKLVRDKIPAVIESQNKSALYKILTDSEYKQALENKLDEEVAEFHESKNVEELADILEVVEALSTVYAKRAKVHFVKARKRRNRGGFSKKIFLVEVDDEVVTENNYTEE